MMAKGFLRKKTKPEDGFSGVQRSNTTASQRPQSNQQLQQLVPQAPTRPKEPEFHPKILSIMDQEWVHQRLLLVYGRAGPDVPFDGQIIIDHHNNSFPSQGFPVTNSHFKALLHLVPGPNNLKFTFIPPPQISTSRFSVLLTLHCLPLTQNPPVHLAVILAKDSEGEFESPPDRPSGLEEGIKKLRTAAYLWQAYTSEQMFRNFPGNPGNGGSARRAFRLEEEWMEDTLSLQETDVWRMSAKVHVVRSALTMDEMKQQAATLEGKGLKGIVRDALELYGGPFELGEGYVGPSPIVMCLLLDSHWRDLMIPGKVDPEPKLRLGVFISRTLWSWPSCLEEAIPSLQDDTQMAPVSPGLGQHRTATYYGSPFEAASAGLGGMLRELGYAFGCILEDPGSTIRNLQTFHRTFITREGQISRTQLQGLRPCLPAHESSWHRLDCLMFRFHPCFRLPIEKAVARDEVMYWPCENGVIVTAPSGIAMILIRVAGKSFPVGWFEYSDTPEHEVFLFETDIVERIPTEEREKDILLEVISAGGGRCRVDWKWIMKNGKTHLPQQVQDVFRSRMVGRGRTEGSTDLGDFIFKDQYMTSGLTNIRISHARSIYSIEFEYEDGTMTTFGYPHPRNKGTDIPIDAAAGEHLTAFQVRAGDYIEAIRIVTNRNKSAWLGHHTGTKTFELLPPQGYEAIGIYGRYGLCCDALGILYTSST